MSNAEALRWGVTASTAILSLIAFCVSICTRRDAVARARRRAETVTKAHLQPIWFRMDLIEQLVVHGARPRLAEPEQRDTA